MTMTKAAKMVSPLRAAFKALMRSQDSVALTANMRYLWDRFMVNPSQDVKDKFWPDDQGRLPGGRVPSGGRRSGAPLARARAEVNIQLRRAIRQDRNAVKWEA
jgi:hypothetical protein